MRINPKTAENKQARSQTVEVCADIVQATHHASPRLNLSYLYQNNGNISQITDATRSETLTYTYDELDRLDTVSGPYSLNHDYNLIGNITAKGTTTYTYGDSAHKHAVTSLSGGGGTYTYDANGNMTQRVEGGLTYTQTFDAENRLISVTVSGQTTQFIYDGDGNLVKKVKPDNSKTIYVGGIYEVDKTSGGSVTRTVTYYPVAGAMRINSTLYYILKDHLGSASVVTDANGNILGENRYYPYGETRLTTGTIFTDKLFTGQREMAGLGIYHYNARFYSHKLGRFLSPDTIVPGEANPQAYNRYSYVLNNPLRYTDPTGHMQYEDPYTESDGVCDPGDTSCNWLGNGNNNNNGNNGNDEDDDVSLLVGLHPDSCTMYACNLPPYNCYYYYCGANVSPRSPDYYNFTMGWSIPGWGTFVSLVLPTITVDRFGNVYVGGGISFGPEAWMGISPSLVGGWISDGPPGEERSEQFLSGMFVNVSGGAVVGGGWNWNPIGGGHSWDLGAYWPQISGTVGGTIYYDANRQEPLWDP